MSKVQALFVIFCDKIVISCSISEFFSANESWRKVLYFDMNDVDISEEEHEENENENSQLREVYIFPRKKAYRWNP